MKKYFKNKQGITLVELLVGLVIGAVVVLIVGSISKMALTSNSHIQEDAALFNDMAYGFKMIRKYGREATTIATASWSAPTGGVGVSAKIVITNTNATPTTVAFGLFEPTGGTNRQLVFMPTNTESNFQILANLPDKDIDWTLTCGGGGGNTGSACGINANISYLNIALVRSNSRINLDNLSTNIMKRAN